MSHLSIVQVLPTDEAVKMEAFLNMVKLEIAVAEEVSGAAGRMPLEDILKLSVSKAHLTMYLN
jgi:hypothetical protein